MDALLESMHTIGEGDIYGFRVINNENEQNVITKAQVAAAKAKGWKPLYNAGNNNWKEYEGSDDTTGISDAKHLNVEGETSKGKLFDLQGRKLSTKPARGIYIEEGKKRMVK